MTKEQNDVKAFMAKAGQQVTQVPAIPSFEDKRLRFNLIYEELNELAHAFGLTVNITQNVVHFEETHEPDLVAAYDAVLDIAYVTVGAAVTLGLDLTPGWDEVQASNMSKFIDGHRRADGKWVKGPSARKPNLAPIVDAQIAAATERLRNASATTTA